MPSFLKHTFNLILTFGLVSVAHGVTARPGVMTTGTSAAAISASGRRMPTLAAALTQAANTATTTTTTTSTASLLDDTKCVDQYLTCIKSPDICGSNFEECTNRVLFHGKMPQCLSVLYQCSTGGIQKLFGTNNMNVLGDIATKNEYDEVTDYTYPKDNSALGQLITAGAISNMYDTSNCVRRYTTCLNRENVCGSDFELCTSNTEFRKQRVSCDSVLARCQSEGLKELFGTASRTVDPDSSSRVGTMIADGATMAAINAVSTCYRVVDQCILNACTENPYKCYENTPQGILKSVEFIVRGNVNAMGQPTDDAMMTALSKSDINKYIRGECMDTIGQNKYCYATFIGEGKMPTNSELRDEFNQEDVFSQAYSTRMNSGMMSKISDLVNKFDTSAKEKCTTTIRSCAMRTCGGGSGAACFKLASAAGINGTNTYDQIKKGCASVVNTDPNCIYAAQNPTSSGTFDYAFNKGDAFEILFPAAAEGKDPIGVIANLDATLNNSYNDAAIAQMKKQCQTLATSCVKSMCGTDYVNCYRNRTDVMSSLTNTGDAAFDKSMNKVGGVLDYTIILGLCVNTIKNSDVCAEHLAIETAKLDMSMDNNLASTWGMSNGNNADSVRSGWYDAGSASKVSAVDGVKKTDADGNEICTNASGIEGVCYEFDSTGAAYDKPVFVSVETYKQEQAANSLFKDLVYDIEKEAQAKYNAKLTKEQNMCLSSNSGGIMGNSDNGSTYMWVKLKGKSVPKSYAVSGLQENQFVASNDLYGSFCRMRVTLQSNDQYIQNAIQKSPNWSTAYFALGDTFTCGSWLSSDDLSELADAAAQAARVATGLEDKDGNATNKAKRQKGWITAAAALGLGTGGAFLGNAIADGKTLGGLTKNSSKKNTNYQNACKNNTENALSALKSPTDYDKWQSAFGYISNMLSAAKKLLEISDSNTNSSYTALNNQYSTIQTTVPGLFGYKESNKKWEIKNDNDQAATAATTAATTENMIRALKTECENSEQKEGWFQNWGGATIVGAGTALAGGLAAYHIVQDAHKSKLDAAEQEAYQEFMDNIGSKITCFIGADEVGTYGDMISTSMTE